MEARAKNSSFIHHSVIISRLAFHNELPFFPQLQLQAQSEIKKHFLQFRLQRGEESEK